MSKMNELISKKMSAKKYLLDQNCPVMLEMFFALKWPEEQ